LALEQLLVGGDSNVYNLGNGAGFSVKQVIEIAKKVTNKNIPIKVVKRRIGDPARLVADSKQIQLALNWKPQYSDLATIISDAWRWEIDSAQKRI
jgi:UDP-glucose 4-epimerase